MFCLCNVEKQKASGTKFCVARLNFFGTLEKEPDF
jgi:hypothetical protein